MQALSCSWLNAIFKTQVTYLGHVVTENGAQTDMVKIEVIKIPCPD